MSASLTAAIGELLRPQSLRIHYLPGLPAEYYTATAPCLLAQLVEALESSSGGHGGRTGPGARIPVNTDAYDLWMEIASNVHGWAAYLHVDRRAYVGPLGVKRAARPADLREPDWIRRLGPYLRGDVDPAWYTSVPTPGLSLSDAGPSMTRTGPSPSMRSLPASRTVPFATTDIPPLGLLLRAVAAQAVAAGEQQIADRLERKAGVWATRIRTMLAMAHRDERVYPIRGAACPSCDQEAVIEDRGDDGTYRVAALVVWMLPVEGGDPDDLWPYSHCRACGEEGWLDYTTETDPGQAA